MSYFVPINKKLGVDYFDGDPLMYRLIHKPSVCESPSMNKVPLTVEKEIHCATPLHTKPVSTSKADEYLSGDFPQLEKEENERDNVVYLWPPSNPEKSKGLVYIQHGYRYHSRAICLNTLPPVNFKDFCQDRKKALLTESENKLKEFSQEIGQKTEAYEEQFSKLRDRLIEHHNAPSLPSGYKTTFDKDNLTIYQYEGSLVEIMNNEGYHVIAMDLYGHGLSHNNDHLNIRYFGNHVSDVFTMLRHLRSGKCSDVQCDLSTPHKTALQHLERLKMVIIGTSMGGNIALQASLTWGHELRKAPYNLIGVQLVGGMFHIPLMESIKFYQLFGGLVRGAAYVLPNLSFRPKNMSPYPWADASEFADPLVNQGKGMSLRYIAEMDKSVKRVFELLTSLNFASSSTTNSKNQHANLSVDDLLAPIAAKGVVANVMGVDCQPESVDSQFDVKYHLIHNVTDHITGYAGSIKVHEMLLEKGYSSRLDLLNILHSDHTDELLDHLKPENEGLDLVHALFNDVDAPLVNREFTLKWITEIFN